VQATVLEPCKLALEMSMGPAGGDVSVKLSDMRLNLSPDVLELMLALQSSIIEPLVHPPPDRCGHKCHYKSC
jgi:hypothetical protein